jgi:LuxR family maltose regulon positive regulatory protein
LGWVEVLPAEVLSANPLLRIELCAAHYVRVDFQKSNLILEALGDSLPEVLKTAPNPGLTEELFLNFRVLHEATRGNISKAIEEFSRAQALKTGDELANLLGRNYLLLAYVVAGDIDNALRIAHPSFEELISRGYSFQGLSNAKNAADAYILQGRLNDSIDLCQQAIELCQLGGVRSPAAGVVGFPIGTVLLERNALQLAEDYVQEALDLLAKGPIGNDFGQGYALLAMIKQAQGHRERALQLIEHALQIAEFAGIPRMVHLIQAYRARIWLAQGEIGLVSNWADAYRLVEPTEYPREVEDLTLAHVLIGQGQCAEAYDLLNRLLPKARAAKRDGKALEVLVLLSLVHSLQNRIGEAIGLLEDTLRIACREGYRRVYLDQGEPMQALMRLYGDRQDVENRRIQPGGDELLDYVDKLLMAFEVESAHQQ